jgi:hypothetical protein
MFGIAALASILTAAVGCDKRPEKQAPIRLLTSLTGKPTVLYLLFGDRDDPRLLPVAAIAHGRVSPITLDPDGWRNFDQLYFRAGARVPIYSDGRTIGDAEVTRGMWEGNAPLYKLPGCRALRPLAAATLATAPPGSSTLELLGTSDTLLAAPARPTVTPAEMDTARAVAARMGQRAGLTATARAELDLTVNAIQTGVSGQPTLVATYMERGTGAGGRPRHVFALSDSAGSGYATSYMHTARDSIPEFRRLLDHVDLTGDGVDEIVLEGWTVGGDSYLVIMQHAGEQWREIARGANSWCADPPKI